MTLRFASAGCCLLVWILSLCTSLASEVIVIPIHGAVSEAQFFFVRRAIKDAEREKASAVILDMDTYGGELNAAVKMQEAFFRTSVPTYSYVNPNAGSAGALIAVSTKGIYMAPVSAIGAAAPVLSSGDDIPKTMSDKMVSYFSGYFRSAAERNGHNPDLAEAFINKEKEVVIGGTTVHSKGSVLTLSAQEAVQEFGNKPLLATAVVPTIEDLVQRAGFPGSIRRVEPSGFEQLALVITALAPLFLIGGILGAYIEIKTPGFGFPGIASITCFLLFFAGHYIAGLAGWEVLVVFLVGLALLVSELLLHPGTILPGLVGAFLIVGSLLYAMVDRYPGQSVVPSLSMLLVPSLKLLFAIVVGTVGTVLLARWLPATPIYRRLVLQAYNPPGPSLAQNAPAANLVPGTKGETLSILRPSGRARFGDITVDVVTEGDFVPPGTAVRVVAVEGSRIVVQA